MDEDSSVNYNIVELISQLRQEKLLIYSEKNDIKRSHEKVTIVCRLQLHF